MNISALIDELGGYAAVASSLGVLPGTVASWRHRRSIPAAFWPWFIQAATDAKIEGVTLERLAAAHARKPRERASSLEPVAALA